MSESTAHHFLGFIQHKYVSHKGHRTAYWMSGRYEKPELSGCTLWLITSRESPGRKYRTYTLVAKLANCAVEKETYKKRWPIKLQGDVTSQQYASNFMNYVLMGLRFQSDRTIDYFDSRIGRYLQNIRELTSKDVALLEDFASGAASQPAVFLSYSHQETRIDVIEVALERSGIGVFRDLNSITLGQNWRTAIKGAIEQASVFVYLHSEHAAASNEVRNEIELALNAQENRQGAIISVLNEDQELPSSEPFRRLAYYQFLRVREDLNLRDLRKLVLDIHKTIVEKNVRSHHN
ncbi:MAG: toll/interleukin-1 receptor domain-containing protein [bacterium]|nr:toll/interleukin-1 receptor domain-containing protein [bacterium]